MADTLGAVAVLDDRDASRVAQRRGVALTGTVAILVQLNLVARSLPSEISSTRWSE